MHGRQPHQRNAPGAGGRLELNVRHNGIVHKHVVLLKVTTEHSPRVDET